MTRSEITIRCECGQTHTWAHDCPLAAVPMDGDMVVDAVEP